MSAPLQMPPGFPLSPIDADGSPLRVGTLVLIRAIPDSLTHDLPADDIAALRALEGCTRRILRFDDHGFAWFGENDSTGWFSLRPDELRVADEESQA
jgi:hypothetical protein